jgi:hypothetical protein
MHASKRTGTSLALALAAVVLLWTGVSAEPLTATRSIPLPAPVVQGLAYAEGSLWTLSPMGPGMTTLIRMDAGSGVASFTFFGSVQADALAHDGTHLYATRFAGEWLCGTVSPNRIDVHDPVTGLVVRSFPSPVSTQAGGLALLGGSLYVAGVVDTDLCDGLTGVGTITALHPAGGSFQGSFETGALGGDPMHLASNGQHLLYGTWSGQQGAIPSSFSWIVYSLDGAGNVVGSQVLFETMALTGDQASQSFDIGGMAWGNGELFVLNRSTQTVQVFAFPVAEPPPPPPPPAPAVSLDIRPGDDENCINLRSQGKVPAAVLSSLDFDATTLDPATVTLAGAPVVPKKRNRWMADVEDVNTDGLADLVLHFRTQDLNLTEEDTEATLHGWTMAGEEIECSDHVQVIHGDDRFDKIDKMLDQSRRGNGGEQRLDPFSSLPATSPLSLAIRGPNPSRGAPVVSFTLAGAAPATLDVVRVTGQRVTRLDLGHLGSGSHTLDIGSHRALPPGTYFIRIRQGAASAVTKVSVLP